MHPHRPFDSWSKTYDRSLTQTVLFGPVQRCLVKTLSTRMTPKVVLDVGCGTGRLLDALASVYPGAAVVGIDQSSGMVAAARSARPQLKLVQAAAEALPFRDQAFDLVVSTLSFHHWSDQATAASEIHRVLRPGGWFALADASVDDVPGPLRHLIGTRAGHLLPLAERHRLLDGAGLGVSEVKRALHGRWVPLSLARRT